MSKLHQFFCGHKAKHLHARDGMTEAPSKDFPEDFTTVTYHLYCTLCDKEINIKYAKLIGGVDAFFERGRSRIN